MKLPNADRAVVDIAKLRGYCLSTTHPVGKHKARVFAAALGLTAADADLLLDAVLDAARLQEATAGEEDEYGRRYTVDFLMSGPAGQAMVRSCWIIRHGEEFARLTTCCVL